MLASLRIRNFALVERLEWDVPGGFVAITGETGAGKSILIGGLKLLLGDRADRSLIRAGAEECSAEAVFQVGGDAGIAVLLDEAGVEPCEGGQLVLKRTVAAGGGGRQLVNGSACTLALLRNLGDRLVDLHGPHDHQSLLSREAQTRLLDAYAGAERVRREYEFARRAWVALEAEQRTISTDDQAALREIDLLSHQVREIEATDLKPDEEEPLLARQRTAANAQRLIELTGEVQAALMDSEDSVDARLAESGRLLRELSRLDEAMGQIAERHGEAMEALREVARTVREYGDGIEAEPSALRAIEARLDAIETLKRKYGGTVAEVIAFGAQAAARLAELKNRDARREGLAAEVQAAKASVATAGRKLGKARAAAAPKLAESIRKHLNDLGFLKSGFEIQLERSDEPGTDGFETAEFVFSPNPGEPALPLRLIASSGEISRVMLALKTSLAGQDRVPVLVFDEIDANVGGEVAHAVAGKMHEISQGHQVLCITHLPQVAAGANAHFAIRKEVVGGRTQSLICELAGSDRERELARMLGDREGRAALAHARELLRK
jgi:DNA repair protein RecN (Recombination protein N)